MHAGLNNKNKKLHAPKFQISKRILFADFDHQTTIQVGVAVRLTLRVPEQILDLFLSYFHIFWEIKPFPRLELTLVIR